MQVDPNNMISRISEIQRKNLKERKDSKKAKQYVNFLGKAFDLNLKYTLLLKISYLINLLL